MNRPNGFVFLVERYLDNAYTPKESREPLSEEEKLDCLDCAVNVPQDFLPRRKSLFYFVRGFVHHFFNDERDYLPTARASAWVDRWKADCLPRDGAAYARYNAWAAETNEVELKHGCKT